MIYMSAAGRIVKKTILFLSGIFLIIWGYKANMDEIEGNDVDEEIQQQKDKASPETRTETDQAEESSGSQ